MSLSLSSSLHLYNVVCIGFCLRIAVQSNLGASLADAVQFIPTLLSSGRYFASRTSQVTVDNYVADYSSEARLARERESVCVCATPVHIQAEILLGCNLVSDRQLSTSTSFPQNVPKHSVLQLPTPNSQLPALHSPVAPVTPFFPTRSFHCDCLVYHFFNLPSAAKPFGSLPPPPPTSSFCVISNS